LPCPRACVRLIIAFIGQVAKPCRSDSAIYKNHERNLTEKVSATAEAASIQAETEIEHARLPGLRFAEEAYLANALALNSMVFGSIGILADPIINPEDASGLAGPPAPMAAASS
jgi:hypothetical protein